MRSRKAIDCGKADTVQPPPPVVWAAWQRVPISDIDHGWRLGRGLQSSSVSGPPV